MPKISVICAAPPGPNPGMSSVDLAFHSLARRLNLADDTRFCHLYNPAELHASDRLSDVLHKQAQPFTYHCFRDRLDEVYDSNAIVFWGDFLHARHYHHGVARILLDIRAAADEAQALELVRRHFLFTDAPPDVLARTLLFGETMIFNRQPDYLLSPYGQDIARFMQGIRRVWMRDVYSALKVAQLRRQYEQSHLGLDCSLLLRDADIESLPAGPWSAHADPAAGRIGIFFGRSSGSIRPFTRAVAHLAKKLDRPVQWLPWGDSSAFDDYQKPLRRRVPNLQWLSAPGTPAIGDLYRLLRGYSLVISDTYHVCVNAWRLGVPALCIGQAAPRTAWSVSSGKSYAWRDKRHTFYSMYDAMDYYVFADELADRRWRDRRIYQLSELARDTASARAIVARIHQHRDAVEQQLTHELRALTAPAAS